MYIHVHTQSQKMINKYLMCSRNYGLEARLSFAVCAVVVLISGIKLC